MAPTAIPVENSYHPRFTARLKTAGIIAHETHVVDRLRDGTVRRVVPVAAVSGYRVTSRAARDNQICNLSKFLYRSLFDLDSAKFPGDWLHQLGKSTISIGSNWVEGLGKRGTPKACLSNWRHARGSAYEASFQFQAVGMHGLAHLADDVSDLIDEAIASYSLSRVDEDSVGEQLKGVVAPRAGTATPGLEQGHGGSHAAPAADVEPSRALGRGLTGERAISNLVPSEGNSTDALKDESVTQGRLNGSLLPWPGTSNATSPQS